MKCVVRKRGQVGRKYYNVHRFVWESFDCIIPEGKEIEHIDDFREDNRLCNFAIIVLPREW